MSQTRWIDPETGRLREWTRDEPARETSHDGDIRIRTIPARWGSSDTAVAGEFLQILYGPHEKPIGDFRCAQHVRLLTANTLPAGRIHIGFGLADYEHVLMIDPEAESCRLAGGEWQPLGTMQDLIDAALNMMRPARPDPFYFRHSPCGRFRADYFETEYRNNEWLPSPEIHDMDTGEVILKGTHMISNGVVSWLEDRGQFVLDIRNTYMPHIKVLFDVDAGTVRIDDDPEKPIGEARILIEKRLRAEESKFMKRWRDQPPGPREPYNWKAALLSTAIAALAMLALLYFGGLI